MGRKNHPKRPPRAPKTGKVGTGSKPRHHKGARGQHSSKIRRV